MGAVLTAAYTSASTYPLNHARIGYQSWTDGLTTAAITASSEATNFPKDGPLTMDTIDGWKPTAAGTWAIDLGQARAVNYVGIVGALNGVAVTIHHSTNNVDWVLFSASTTPTDNGPLMFLDASISRRYWRITLGAVGTVFVVRIGTLLEMERPFFDGFSVPTLARQTEIRSSLTRGARFLGQDIIRYGFKTSFPWRNLTPSWYRTYFDPVVKHLRTLPAFFAWNLNYPAEIVYGWSGEDIAPEQEAKTAGGVFNVAVNIRGLGYAD